ncbi:MAG: putative motility protein [Chitinispirillales bacterium]|nr:putative motility protein [Chitinispirillales bacterium]
MDGVSLNTGGQVLGAINIAMLKKTQDLVSSQIEQIIQSIPQSPNFGGAGGQIDVTA